MTRINSRDKGMRGEKQAIEWWQDWTGMDYKRSPASGGLRGHVVDYTVGDIICVKKNYIFPLTIEVKNYKDINFEKLLYNVDSEVVKFWEQALDDAVRGEKMPMLLMRFNGLAKGLFFVVMAYLDYKILKNYITVPYPKAVVFTAHKHKLFLTTTMALKTTDWKKFEKAARVIQKKRWQKDQ
jgi:Holliday junction resolvase